MAQIIGNRTVKVAILLTGMALLAALLNSPPLYAADVDDIKAAISAKGAGWVAGETPISKLKPEERRRRLGAIEPPFTGRERMLSAEDFRELALPSSLDWRNYGGKNYVTGVRDQGNCGSCWAFATTAALESSVLLGTGSAGYDLNLAEQVLVSCSGAGNCDGGYTSSASDYIVSTGLPAETCYPYAATNGSCSGACSNWQSSAYTVDDWLWVTTSSPSADTIKTALYNYGPLVTQMYVYTDFYYYKGGTYSYSWGSYEGGHAVLLVGYNDSGQYFIAKNSWGTSWGESGYFKIAYSQLTNSVGFGKWTIAYDYDNTGPTGSVSINSGKNYTTSTSVTLTLSCSDSRSGCSEMKFSNNGSSWSSAETYSTSKSWTLTSGDGTKTVYARFKDSNGNWSGSYFDTITLDTTMPVDGTLSASTTSGKVTLSWSGFSDATSGIGGYLLSSSTAGFPASCSGGTSLSSSTSTYEHTGLTDGVYWYYRLCAVDNAGKTSPGAIDFAVVGSSDCAYAVYPSVGRQSSASGSGSITVYSTNSVCSWTATDDADWLDITSSAGTGDGTISYTATENTSTYPRVAGLTVGDGTSSAAFSVVQRGRPKTDFDSDSKPDLLWQNSSTRELAVWYMDGSTRKSSAFLSPSKAPDTDWKVVGADDFNLDGKTDLLWQHQSKGSLAVWYMDGVTATGSAFLTPSSASTSWKIVGTEDFDSDGDADILWQNPSKGSLLVWYMDGITAIGSASLSPSTVADTNWRVVGTDDFDSDGKPDLLWQHQSKGSLAVWYMDGVTRKSYSALSPSALSDTNWKVVGTDDFDSDGDADIVFQNSSTRGLAVWYMDGVTRTSSTYLTPSTVGSTYWKIMGEGMLE